GLLRAARDPQPCAPHLCHARGHRGEGTHRRRADRGQRARRLLRQAGPGGRMNGRASPLRRTAMRLSANGAFILVLIVIVVVAVSVVQPRFLSQQNIINVLRNTAILSIISMGQMMVMIAGGFDLSVGVIVAFASIETALVMSYLLQLMPDMAILAVVLAILISVATGA